MCESVNENAWILMEELRKEKIYLHMSKKNCTFAPEMDAVQ